MLGVQVVASAVPAAVHSGWLSALFGSHCMASWGMVTGTSSASDAAGRHIQPVLNGILFMMVLSKTFTKEGRHSGARTIVAPLRPNDV